MNPKSAIFINYVGALHQAIIQRGKQGDKHLEICNEDFDGLVKFGYINSNANLIADPSITVKPSGDIPSSTMTIRNVTYKTN